MSKSSEYQLREIYHQLEQLRELLTQAADGKLDVRFENPHLVKCWEEKNCIKTDCPSYHSKNLRCWQVAGTFCGGEVQGVFAQKLGNCLKCEVFRKSCWGDPITEIGEYFCNVVLLLERQSGQLQRQARQLTALNKLFRQLMDEKERMEAAYQSLTGQVRAISSEFSEVLFAT
ncbi:MAG: hypothetical protein HYU86_07450 [Chloroflexi bacterium]|nr:hypothetical protein [Chloroflexota bacterium]